MQQSPHWRRRWGNLVQGDDYIVGGPGNDAFDDPESNYTIRQDEKPVTTVPDTDTDTTVTV